MPKIINNAEEQPVEEFSQDKDPTGEHPDWHPFAVWQAQMRNDQTVITGEHRVLSSAKIADA